MIPVFKSVPHSEITVLRYHLFFFLLWKSKLMIQDLRVKMEGGLFNDVLNFQSSPQNRKDWQCISIQPVTNLVIPSI